jgi:hypothetical protein
MLSLLSTFDVGRADRPSNLDELALHDLAALVVDPLERARRHCRPRGPPSLPGAALPSSAFLLRLRCVAGLGLLQLAQDAVCAALPRSNRGEAPGHLAAKRERAEASVNVDASGSARVSHAGRCPPYRATTPTGGSGDGRVPFLLAVLTVLSLANLDALLR